MPVQASFRAGQIGFFLTAGGAVLFSLKAVVVKLSYGHAVDPVTLQALRMALSVPVYLLIALLLQARRPAALGARQWLAVTGLGLCGYYLASYLDLAGLSYVSAGLERLILYAYPTLVLIFSRVLFGRRIQRREAIAMAVSYLGLAVVFVEDARRYDQGVLIGGALVFGSAAAYALFMIGSGRLIPQVGSMRFTCYAMTAAGIGIGAHFVVTQPADLMALPVEVYQLGVLLAVGCTTLPSFLLAAGIARVGAERAALIGMIGPASTVVSANLLLGEAITAVHVLGSVLILSGVISLTSNPVSAGKGTGIKPSDIGPCGRETRQLSD